jgi:hypothetical protein
LPTRACFFAIAKERQNNTRIAIVSFCIVFVFFSALTKIFSEANLELIPIVHNG